MTDLDRLVQLGVATIDPASRDDGWLEWLERGTLNWDDKIAYADVPYLRFYLDLSARGIG